MRRALAAVALLAFLPTAHAQDKAKGEFTHAGEFRMRDDWRMTPTGNKGAATNTANERFKLDLGFKAAEKLKADLSLIYAGNIGRAADRNNTPGQNTADMMFVEQAYATWMTSDDFTLKAGRMNYQIGDGTLISVNDWEQTPYAFEGLLGNYEAEFGRFQLFLFKHSEYTGSTAADGEQNSYGLNFDLKTMPEMLKMVNVHILKDSADHAGAGTTIKGAQGKDILRYGLNVGLAFNIVDVKAWYEAYSGKNKFTAAGVENRNTDGNMMQAEVGVNLPNFMGSRVFVKYHQDSGDSDVSGGTDDTKDQTYDAYYHEQHGSAGMMDLYDWGNLTFTELGWTGKPTDTTEVGLSYWMLSRTKKGANSSAIVNGTSNGFVATGDKEKAKLGDEIDLWGAHKYDNGLTTVLRFSYFMPGDVYTSSTRTDPPTGAAGDKLKEKPMQIFAEARFNF